MRIDAELTYAADCHRVADVTRDPDFQDAKCKATGALSWTVDVTDKGGRTVISTTRQMPTDGLPDFAKSLIKDGITVTEVDDWGPPADDGSRDGTVEVTFRGAPITMKGTLALRPSGAGAQATVAADLKAQIPLFGAKIEKACSEAVLAAIRVEERTAAEWLARS